VVNKLYLSLLVVLVGSSATAQADDSLPLRSVNQANEVIAAALQAHGGEVALKNLNSLVQDQTITVHATNQSRGTEPPWDQNQQSSINAIDFGRNFIYASNMGSGGGFEFSGATIVDGKAGWQLDYRAGNAAPVAETDFKAVAGPFIRITPALVMKQLMERKQYSHWLGTESIDGRLHDVVTLVMETGPALSVFLDSETHMLKRMERALPPFGQAQYRYEDYETIAGIPFNRSFHLLINGEPNIDIQVSSIKVNVPIDHYALVPAELERIAVQTPDEFSLQEIDEGVFLVGGNGAYGLFIEMSDHVIAIGGTQGAKERMEEVAKQVNNKPVRYGVLTHHHSDHVPAAADYASVGATIIAAQAHEAIVRQASKSEEAKFEWVKGSMTLDDGLRRVEFYDIGPTSHSEHMLIAWLPDEKIIFEADHFPQPINGPLPPAVDPTRDLAAAIEKLGLDYQHLVGAHSSRIATPADMQQVLNGKVANFRPKVSAP